MIEKKSPLNTIRAFARCATRCAGVTLTFIGAGPLLASCISLAADLGVSGSVTFLGAQNNDRVRDEMTKSGVFVQHSVTAANGDEEGWPVAIAEALATGLPVIATRHSGILDQIIHGENGYLVAEGNWERMSEYMIKLAREPQKRRELGVAGRKHIERYGNTADRIEDLRQFIVSAVT